MDFWPSQEGIFHSSGIQRDWIIKLVIHLIASYDLIACAVTGSRWRAIVSLIRIRYLQIVLGVLRKGTLNVIKLLCLLNITDGNMEPLP